MRKPDFLHNVKTKTQISFVVTAKRLCFRYTDSTIPLLPKYKFQASSHLMGLYSPVSVGPGRKHRRPAFSQRVLIKSQILTLSLEPSIVEAVSSINTRARFPGLHNSFSSWPIITARASIRI